ncbi:ABC transporter permease [Bacillus thuringiensis]|uniref:ABC transporter permease n=2 Tax=Bacillus thuringiensis TaxID=1428 RepID=A0AB35P964_BACTU|nr:MULTISPECIES: ABC transporter permease [Bacillus]EAO54433.1 ABC transporter permease protein [Bacillus thuringiensis serovar israelensis ATCC 35646]MCU5407831.1 ABC transporter permease [Bacillus cereus]MED1156032.1 ABC transporter permease [Bacillus paranthracis]AJH03134.1 ftsX-like permease family protein [Bacillus thuringiensis HD1002]APF32496.1 permease [Bacillus thuringiensis serovar israelensis]
MNFIKRAILSMKKRIGTSLILMAVFLIVTNLVLAGFAIQNASKKAADAARKKLGADVTLGLDFDKLGQQARETGEMPKPPKLNTKEADQLAKSKYVKDYNYITNTFGISDGFKLVGASEGEDEGKGRVGMVAAAGGSGSGSEIDMNSSLIIEGVRKTVLQESFKNGKSKIIDGKPITEKMKDQNVTLMEKRLAEQNNLKVGDKIKIQSGDKKQTLEFEIIGIYETNEQPMGQHAPPMMDPANKLYMPYSTLKKLEVDEGMSSIQVVYLLNDPQYIDAFKKEAKKSDIDFNYFKLDAHDSLYKQMIGPIENIASTSQMIIYMVSIAGAIILGLIIMLSIKARRKEMGILLSIGEKKWKLMAQFVVEVVCIAILAFGLSLTTGAKVSQFVGDNLLSSEVATAGEETDTSQNGTVMVAGPGGTVQNQKEDPIDKINVSVTGEDVGKMGGIGLAIAILATLLPALSILRLNPKQILLKDE